MIKIKCCDTGSILQFQITYHCGKLMDYLLRVEQKARSHPHTFLGRCWDGIRLRFHKGKLLCHQVQSSGNCWSGQTPGIADVFPRCTLEIRFLHIYKCKGVKTIFGTMIYYQANTNFYYLWRTLHIARDNCLQLWGRYNWVLPSHKILLCPSMYL